MVHPFEFARSPRGCGRSLVLATITLLASASSSIALTTFDAARPVSFWATTDSCVFEYSWGYCVQEGDPAVAASEDGVVVVAWNSTVDLSGVNGSTSRILYARSTDGGRTWSLPAYLDAFAGPPSNYGVPPALGTDGAGNFLAAWQSSTFVLLRSTDGGQNWSPVTPAAAPGSSPSFTTSAGTGTIVMAGETSVQRSTDGGQTWGDLTTFSESYYSGYRVATDGAGTWMIVYAPYYGPSRVSVSTDDGVTWSAFSTPFTGGRVPTVATDGSGNWYVATIDSSYPSYSNFVYLARSTDAGTTWTDPVVFLAPAYDYEPPYLLARGDGELELLIQGFLEGSPGNDLDIVTYSSLDHGQTWSRVRAATGSARVSSANQGGSGVDDELAIATTADSTIAVWTSNESLRFDLGEGFDAGYDPDILVAIGTRRCEAAPRGDCRGVGAEGRSSLKVKHAASGNDKLKWSWKRGAATTLAELGNPPVDTDYTLCLYSTASAGTHLIVEQHMDTAGMCRYEDCWQPKSSGFAYGDASGINGAVKRLSLAAGEDGRASLSAQASGPSLGFPKIPIFGLTQMRLQVVQERDGLCWESVLDQIVTHTDRTLTIEGQ